MGKSAKYDLVVIGGGNAGYTPAIRASQLGMRVALVEKARVGGTCLHRGCIPAKALLHSAAMLHDLKHHGTEAGIVTRGIGFDYSRAARRKDEVVGRLHGGLRGLMKKNAISVYGGTGRFAGPRTVEVSGEDGGRQVLEAGRVLIATGSAPRSLPGLEVDHERVVTSDDVLAMDRLPASVIVLGSGAVGAEFASMYNDFGARVTVVEVLDRVVPGEDRDVSAELKRRFEARGIRVLTGAKADPGSLDEAEGGVRIGVRTDDGEEEALEAEMLLVAVGRGPVTSGLNLGATKVETNGRGEIRVDEFYRTAEPGVYAAGDVVGGYALAHVANHEGLIAAEHMAGLGPAPLDPDLVPRVTFTRPEVASFGLTEQQARDDGYDVKVGRFPFHGIGKAVIEGDPGGFVKMVVDAETDLILGMHAVGPRVTETIHEGAFAKLVEGTPEEVAMAVHAHPTLSEAVGEAAMAAEGHAINF